jgi:hypothetical protein
MKKFALGAMIAVSLSLLTGGSASTSVTAQQPTPCLHGDNETAAEQARRFAALRFVRAVNTAHANTSAPKYGALTTLEGLPPIPDGFVVGHAADDQGYVFAVKDATDPCRFAFFSDQEGIIYLGGPIR